MEQMLNKLKHDSSGNSMVEYGLVIGLVALATTASVHGLGQELSNLWNWLVYLSQFLQY